MLQEIGSFGPYLVGWSCEGHIVVVVVLKPLCLGRQPGFLYQGLGGLATVDKSGDRAFGVWPPKQGV